MWGRQEVVVEVRESARDGGWSGGSTEGRAGRGCQPSDPFLRQTSQGQLVIVLVSV